MRSLFLKLLLLACLGPFVLLAQTTATAAPTSANVQADSPPFSVPHYVRFSGTASSSASSTTSARFALYSEQQGGTPLWLETQNIAVEASGRYSVLLGSATKDGVPGGVVRLGRSSLAGSKDRRRTRAASRPAGQRTVRVKGRGCRNIRRQGGIFVSHHGNAGGRIGSISNLEREQARDRRAGDAQDGQRQ